MLPVLQIGPLSIPTPGLVLLLGIWLGLILAEKYSERHGVKISDLYNLVFIALASGVIGARLAYVARYPGVFAESPLSAFSLTPTLLHPFAGAIVGILAAAIYGQRRHLNFWSSMDALTPLLAVFSLALAVSNLASGNAFGEPAKIPWGIFLWGETRHPTQIYHVLLAGLILWVIWPHRGLLRLGIGGDSQNGVHSTLRAGVIFLTFTALTAAAQLIVEAFRGDSILWLFGLRAGQVAAWVILAAVLFLLKGRLDPQSHAQPEGNESK